MRTKLAARALELSERIYTSLPWGYRIARVFMKLSDASEFGPAFYAEFIHKGVSGMDDIGGKPASEYRGKRGLANLLNRKRYGRDFGQKLYATALRKLKSVEVVEDAITDYFIKLRTGKGMGTNLREGTPLSAAEGYAITGVIRTGFDILKKKRRERPSLMREDDGGNIQMIDVTDPSAFKDFASLLSATNVSKMLREIQRYDQQAHDWVWLTLRGWSDSQIAGWLNVSPQLLGYNKTKVWRPELRRIVEKYMLLDEAA